MQNMTISPLQQDYVTKTEFNEFRDEVGDRFDRLEKSIDGKFSSLIRQLHEDNERDRVKLLQQLHEDNERDRTQLMKQLHEDNERDRVELKKQLHEDFVNHTVDVRKQLNEDYERHTGMIHEQMRHDLSAALEQINSTKLEKAEFYEYLDVYVRKPARKRKN